jgi:hypothetical protein
MLAFGATIPATETTAPIPTIRRLLFLLSPLRIHTNNLCRLSVPTPEEIKDRATFAFNAAADTFDDVTSIFSTRYPVGLTASENNPQRILGRTTGHRNQTAFASIRITV